MYSNTNYTSYPGEYQMPPLSANSHDGQLYYTNPITSHMGYIPETTDSSHQYSATGGSKRTHEQTYDDPYQEAQTQQQFEKKRRRRESHNAVERRRRDNINEKIQELNTLLPEQLKESAEATKNGNKIANKDGTLNKGTILKLSVDYVKDLKSENEKKSSKIAELESKNKEQGDKIRELEEIVRLLKSTAPPSDSHSPAATTTTATATYKTPSDQTQEDPEYTEGLELTDSPEFPETGYFGFLSS